MFSFFWNKKRAESIAHQIVETTSQKISDKVSPSATKKFENVTGDPPLEVRQVEKNTYWKLTALKISGYDYAELLLSRKNMSSPEGLSGMWQAYGAMRAARTSGRFTVLASGVMALGLYFYQKVLSAQEEKIKADQNLLDAREKEIKAKDAASECTANRLNQEKEEWEGKRESFESNYAVLAAEMLNSLQLKEKQKHIAENYIQSLCKKSNDKKCWKNYEVEKEKLQRSVISEEIKQQVDQQYQAAKLNP